MSSPYKNTQSQLNGALDILTIRPVPAYADDPLYTIEPQYTHRPDLLAHDMYGSNRLWWIFALVVYEIILGLIQCIIIDKRNPNVKSSIFRSRHML